MSTQVVVKSELEVLKQSLDRAEPSYSRALPAHIDPKRFIRVAQTAVSNDPALLKADRNSLYASVQRAAEMGLLPDKREGAIVMFGDKAQFMPMLGGILKLVRNSGELASIDAQIVHQGDKFTYRPGIEHVPLHEPDWFGDRGEPIGAYAVGLMKDGAAYVEIMSKKQIEQVRNVSRAKNAGPWVQWWEEMARKTVLRRLAKRLPLSTDLDEELRHDDELFAPAAEPEQAPPPANDAAPAPRPRASRLQKVADAAPANPPVDDDGVIDMDANPPAPADSDPLDDSPI